MRSESGYMQQLLSILNYSKLIWHEKNREKKNEEYNYSTKKKKKKQSFNWVKDIEFSELYPIMKENLSAIWYSQFFGKLLRPEAAICSQKIVVQISLERFILGKQHRTELQEYNQLINRLKFSSFVWHFLLTQSVQILRSAASTFLVSSLTMLWMNH